MQHPGPGAAGEVGVTEQITHTGPLWRWSGESAWHFVTVPEAVSDDIASRVDTYWRAHGFPPQCRAVGADDFRCT